MAVRIRLKKMGRRHRSFFRVCAMDSRTPRGGKVLEELGTYDPVVPETDARAILKADRIDYWLGVGAQPTEKVNALIRKYGTNGTHADRQKAALERLAQPKVLPEAGAPASMPKKPEPEAKADKLAKTKAPAKAEAKADVPAKTKAPAKAEAKDDAPAKAEAEADVPTKAEAEAPASEAAPEAPADAAPAEAISEQTTEDETKVEKGETEKVAKTVKKMETSTKSKTEKEKTEKEE